MLINQEESALTIEGLTVCYQDQPALWNIDLTIPQGKLVAVIGPNGAGKSTLIRACLKLTPTLSGNVKLLGMPFQKARGQVAYVPQKESVDWNFPITVRDLVAMGRFGKIGWLRSLRKEDQEIIDSSLEAVGLEPFEKREIHQLSGGQQQRAFLARALAQEAKLYFMDEPFAAVDMATEEHLVGVMQKLCKEGATIFVVHHDLKSVEQNFDSIVLLNRHLVAGGSVKDCLTPALLQEAYGKPVGHLL